MRPASSPPSATPRPACIADDLVTARAALEQELADESRPGRAPRGGRGPAGRGARRARAGLEAALREDLPALAQAQETWFALSGLRERLRGTQSLAAERVRNAEGVGTGDVADRSRPRGARGRGRAGARAGERDRDRGRGAPRSPSSRRVSARRSAEDAVAEEERRVAGLHRAAADRREGLARLHRPGQRAALARRRRRRRDRPARPRPARTRSARATAPSATSPRSRPGSPASTPARRGSTPSTRRPPPTLDDLEEQLAKAREEAQRAERDRASLAARKDALELGLNRKDGAGALLAASDQVSGLLGSVAALLTVRSGFETAVANALGSAADAVALDDADAAIAAIGHLKEHDLGRAGLVLGSGPSHDVERLADAARGRVLRPRRRHLPRRRPPCAGEAARPGRRGRRPRRRPGAARPRRLADRGHPRRRPARRPRRRRWLGQPAEPHRDPGRGRRGRPAAVRGGRRDRAARLRHVPAGARAARGPEAGRRRAGQAARVRRHPGRGGRGARPVRRPGARRPRRGRAARAGDRRGAGGPRQGPRGPRRPRVAAGPRRGGPRPRGSHSDDREQLAEAARAARQGEMEARLALRTAEERVARPARPRRPAAACRPARSARPGPARSSAAPGCSARARRPRPSAPRSPTC